MARPRAAVDWLALAGWIAISFVPAWLGQQYTSPGWYQELRQPAWSPPSALFGPVWTLLYTAMGVAAWLVWLERRRAAVWPTLAVYLVHLVPNALWSYLFFGLRRMDLALGDILLLWALIALLILLFWRVRRAAGLLLVPYLLWVSYASALNLALLRLN